MNSKSLYPRREYLKETGIDFEDNPKNAYTGAIIFTKLDA